MKTIPSKTIKTVDDLPFTPTDDPTALKRAKDFLVNEKKNFCRVSNFAVVTSKDVAVKKGSPCHYRLSEFPSHQDYKYIATEVAPFRTLTYRPNPISDISVVFPFMDYILNRSWASKFITNRDDIEFCLKYGLIIDAGTPSPLVQNICILGRHFLEIREEAFSLFNYLTKEKGYSEDLCYQTIFNTDYSTARPGIEEGGALNPKYTHRVQRCLGVESLYNSSRKLLGNAIIKQGNFRDLYLKEWRNSPALNGGSSLFQDSIAPEENQIWNSWLTHNSVPYYEELLISCPSLQENIKEFRNKVKAVNNVPDPFSNRKGVSAPIPQGKLSAKEVFKFALPRMDELLKEKSKNA